MQYLSPRCLNILVSAFFFFSCSLPFSTRRPDLKYISQSFVMRNPFSKKSVDVAAVDSGSDHADPLAELPKTRWERLWPALACGAGLFSDGYINNVSIFMRISLLVNALMLQVIGSVSTTLGVIYGDAYNNSSASTNIKAITFAGTVLGQLVFGYTSDKWSRKGSLMVSTMILALFAALGAGSYGYHGSIQGMFAALTAYRFLVGIGIGGEYPAGSVACAETSGELKSGTRNRWFIMFTNVMIDWGFVVGAFVPYLLIVICGNNHLRAAWRIMLGLGVVPPMIMIYLRIQLQEPEEFKRYAPASR